jgi:hypothetical protein
MDKIINVVNNINNNKTHKTIYNHILNDLYTNKINIYTLIFSDLEFMLTIPIPLINIDVILLSKYFIFYQHSNNNYYNIFSKTFNKLEKVKYMIYYKNNNCLMCYCNYHTKLQKYFYRGIENEIAVDILKTNNIYTSKVICIYLESFLEYSNFFSCFDDICKCIQQSFCL